MDKIITRPCLVFLKKKTVPNKGLLRHSDKMSAESPTENTPQFIRPICRLSQNIWDMLEKPYWASVFRGVMQVGELCNTSNTVNSIKFRVCFL